MPNHITNIVQINMRYSDDEQSDYDIQEKKLNKLYKKLHGKESDFDFNAILPQPKGIYRGNLSSEDKVAHPLNWYDWNTENWGTKWNAYQVKYLNRSYDDDKTVFEILVKFETAWSPPMPVLEELSKEFEVEFTYKDEGDDTWHDWQKLDEVKS